MRALAGAGHDVRLVVTRADRRRSRRGAPEPSPVKAAAAELGIPVAHRVDAVLDAGAELGVVVAYGRLIRPPVLERLPMVNIHFSLLPRWRGAAPVERALLAGDTTTGVCLMALEEGLDTGPVYACETVAIGEEETASDLRARLSALGSELLTRELAAGLGAPAPQVGEPTYAAKVDPSELELDWRRPARELHRVVRVGRAWTTFRRRRLLVHAARVLDGAGPLGPGEIEGTAVGTGDGALELVEVQPEGRAAQPADAWVRGARLAPGERLGA